jgi:hypothetical protein
MMARFTVRQGKRYRARLELGWLETLASNELITGKLRAAGFTEVTVDGSGRTRRAEALWPNPDSTGELPSQVAEISEILDA